MFYTYMRITLVGYIHASLDIMFLPAPPNILLTYTEDTTNKAYSACFPGIHGTTGFRTRNSAAPNLSTSNQPWAISPSVPSVAFPITHTRALISKKHLLADRLTMIVSCAGPSFPSMSSTRTGTVLLHYGPYGSLLIL